MELAANRALCYCAPPPPLSLSLSLTHTHTVFLYGQVATHDNVRMIAIFFSQGSRLVSFNANGVSFVVLGVKNVVVPVAYTTPALKIDKTDTASVQRFVPAPATGLMVRVGVKVRPLRAIFLLRPCCR